ncbi:hypothetical protein KQH82_06265 [bacterium]|nr:hypothetical protein [bacterium]
MKSHSPVWRGLRLYVALWLFVWSITSSLAIAQANNCTFDRQNPTLESARSSFGKLDYDCAREELLALLDIEGIQDNVAADAHGLLAAIYFSDEGSRSFPVRKIVVQQELVNAIRLDSLWTGPLAINEELLRIWLEDARERVREERDQARQDSLAAISLQADSLSQSSRGFLRYVLAAAGSAAIGVTIWLLTKTDPADDQGTATTPDFPGPPGN